MSIKQKKKAITQHSRGSYTEQAEKQLIMQNALISENEIKTKQSDLILKVWGGRGRGEFFFFFFDWKS